MIDDCRDGKIDLIMTKSISRFARNLDDCISCIRELKDLGIPVIFEKESLNTLDNGCDMLISVLAALSQEESNNISRSIRWANEYRNSAGTPTRPARYGYRKKGQKWEIFEPEAERVSIAFHMAAEGSVYKNIVMTEQGESFETQVRYYQTLIEANPDWENAGIYADEGYSGTTARHRPEFMRLIKDALSGKIDIIITKSISRFARNAVDCQTYTKKLKRKGVEVQFEREGHKQL